MHFIINNPSAVTPAVLFAILKCAVYLQLQCSGARLIISSLTPIDIRGGIESSKTLVIASPRGCDITIRNVLSAGAFSISISHTGCCQSKRIIFLLRFAPTTLPRGVSPTAFHRDTVFTDPSCFAAWTSIDLCFFGDKSLDGFQAVQFPSFCSLSHQSMWRNCMKSLSHSSGSRGRGISRREYLSVTSEPSPSPPPPPPQIPETKLPLPMVFFRRLQYPSWQTLSFGGVRWILFQAKGQLRFSQLLLPCLHLTNTL